MTKRLVAQDGQAVDLLLNKAKATSASALSAGATSNMRHDATTYAAPVGDETRSRIARVKALLGLIQEMPAGEPPAGLVERTMARIDAGANGEPVRDASSAPDSFRPPA